MRNFSWLKRVSKARSPMFLSIVRSAGDLNRVVSVVEGDTDRRLKASARSIRLRPKFSRHNFYDLQVDLEEAVAKI
jgi:hypothetical protein